MKFYKVVFVVLLMLCTFGAYAQEQKYFTGVLVIEAGKTQFIIGNIMNSSSEILNHMEVEGVTAKTALWTGKGEIKNDKIVWIDESPLFVIDEEFNQKVYMKFGDGIAALKSFLDSDEGSAIKAKYFTADTEYFDANEVNPYETKSLKALEYPFKARLLDYNLSLIQKIVGEVSGSFVEMGTFQPFNKKIMQGAAKVFLGIYESAMLIEPSLNTETYQKTKFYLEKMQGNNYTFSTKGLKSLLKDMAEDVNATCKNSLYETTVVMPELDHLFMPITVEDPEEYFDTPFPIDAKELLGKDGLLTTALSMANSEMGQDAHTPDVVTCAKIRELARVMLLKLNSIKGVNVMPVSKQYLDLNIKIGKYNLAAGNEAVTDTYLDVILEKKTLGDIDFYELFGKTSSIASSMIEKYNKDPNNPINAIKILVVEKLRRRFETISNENKISSLVSFEITTNDFFKTDSKDYNALKSVVDNIKEEKLEARNTEEKEGLEKYKMDLESIDNFELK
jgi:hypothetical protein